MTVEEGRRGAVRPDAPPVYGAASDDMMNFEEKMDA